MRIANVFTCGRSEGRIQCASIEMKKEHEDEEFTTKEDLILDLAISYVIQGSCRNDDLTTDKRRGIRERKAFRFTILMERCLS